VHHNIVVRKEMKDEIQARIDVALADNYEYRPGGEDMPYKQDDDVGRNYEAGSEEEVTVSQKVRDELKDCEVEVEKEMMKEKSLEGK
jgi:hypothetical protein